MLGYRCDVCRRSLQHFGTPSSESIYEHIIVCIARSKGYRAGIKELSQFAKNCLFIAGNNGVFIIVKQYKSELWEVSYNANTYGWMKFSELYSRFLSTL